MGQAGQRDTVSCPSHPCVRTSVVSRSCPMSVYPRTMFANVRCSPRCLLTGCESYWCPKQSPDEIMADGIHIWAADVTRVAAGVSCHRLPNRREPSLSSLSTASGYIGAGSV